MREAEAARAVEAAARAATWAAAAKAAREAKAARAAEAATDEMIDAILTEIEAFLGDAPCPSCEGEP